MKLSGGAQVWPYITIRWGLLWCGQSDWLRSQAVWGETVKRIQAAEPEKDLKQYMKDW